ncbi:GNAT family N-acetyltransferase [Anoxynatronum buryatiense]|uniref:Acetyltransferase n=1 Tax=Anoxynatronum buryatiense TaxID=489973 RepID=A0AA45WU04_9CLOT|nr:GNAT family N-acetyltransferase [Anoxynatronum buryatiense]SMP45548.1 putative acetyltransferase [Anoxynatronum buryatiense]
MTVEHISLIRSDQTAVKVTCNIAKQMEKVNDMHRATIRAFQKKDLNTVMELWLDTNTAAHDFIGEDYWRANYDTVKQMIPDAAVYVYEDQSVKGFVGLIGNYLAGIFIEKSEQSKGIGKLLLDYIKMNNEDLLLQVYKKNSRAVQFYQREGFVVDKEQIEENTNEIELVMKWRKK